MGSVAQQKRSAELMCRLAEAMQETGNKTEAARRCGVTPSIVQRWHRLSKANPEDPRFLIEDPLGEEEPTTFYNLVEEALLIKTDECLGVIFDEIDHRKPVIHQGELCYLMEWESYEETDPLDMKTRTKWRKVFALDPITGKPIPLTVRETRGDLAMKILAAHIPEKYGAKVAVDHTTQGRPIQQGPAMTVEQFKAEFGTPIK